MKSYLMQYRYNFMILGVVLAMTALGMMPDPAFAALPLLALGVAPFPVQPELTAIAIAYRNSRMIADDVLPRVPVGVQTFKYMKQTLADSFTLPDSKVGRKSRPNQVDFTATEQTGTCENFALDDPVPQEDIDNAPPNYNPLGVATEGVTNLVLLGREKRAADLVFDANQYAAANKVTLSGTGQWSDFTNSDPITAILNALDTMIMRGNVMVLGRAVATKLMTHPRILKAFNGTSGDTGIVPRNYLAALFELDEVLVGEGWLNSAKKGQATSMARVWGKHASLIFRDRTATTRGGTTFGLTAQFGGRVAGSIADPNIGMRGGQNVRAGESVKELITANDLGYLFTNAVA